MEKIPEITAIEDLKNALNCQFVRLLTVHDATHQVFSLFFLTSYLPKVPLVSRQFPHFVTANCTNSRIQLKKRTILFCFGLSTVPLFPCMWSNF